MLALTQPLGFIGAVLDNYPPESWGRAYDEVRFELQADVLLGVGWTRAPRRGWWTDGKRVLPQRDAFPLAKARYRRVSRAERKRELAEGARHA